VEPLTHEGIQRIVHAFGDSAERVVEAGFELIEIHGAHGYLINSFLSRFSNIREDEYGGDIDNRARFGVEIIKEVRKRVGDSFPLSFKISAQEFVPDGLTTEESIELLKVLVPAGIDIVQVSAGNDATPEWICQPMFMKKACLADSAEKIREALDVPVMSVGRINDPIVADAIITEGKADLVCMGRGLLADPELPNKAKKGNLDDIRICIACNTCMESIFRNGRIECLVNPTLGREKEMEIHPTDKPKKVMVVGGGPGGLDVAWISAKRGHEVHLYERDATLGGQLNLATVADYKMELLNLISFQKTQIEKSNVKIHLNHEVTLDTVMEESPDVVILATGSVPFLPPMPGIEKPIILTPTEVFNGRKPGKAKTIVVGGGPTGCEVAQHLSENGSPVTIVELLPKIAGQLESITRKVLLGKLKANSVRFMTEYRVARIEENGVYVIGTDEKESFIEAEAVVMAVGNKPVNGLHEEIKAKGITSYQIGDCLEPRSAKAAIYEGAVIGRTI
jgi:thioredoxin reductase